MRIFQILEFNQFNTGSVHQMFQAAAGLRERGHEVTIVSRPDEVLRSRSEELGIRFQGLALRHQFDIPSIVSLRRLIRGERPDVIHVHKGIAHAVALAASARDRVPAFVVNRGVSFPLDAWNRGKYRTARVDRVVTVCQQIKDVIVESGRLPPAKVQVIYAGTDVALFDPARCDSRAFRREKGIADDRFLVGQVGVRDWKGWQELIEALARIAPAHPRAHLALIACRTLREADDVMQFARARGVGDRVTAVEYRTDMPDVLSSCDLVVDASWAGTGITGTIREAMALARPVVATNCGGNAELVSSPEVGWLIPPKDVGALAAAIVDVMSDPRRAMEVGANARAHVVAGFSKELRIEKLERLYEEIRNTSGKG